MTDIQEVLATQESQRANVERVQQMMAQMNEAPEGSTLELADSSSFEEAVRRASETQQADPLGQNRLSQLFGVAMDIQNRLDDQRTSLSETVEALSKTQMSRLENDTSLDEHTKKLMQTFQEMNQNSLRAQATLNEHALNFQMEMVEAKWFRTLVTNVVSSVKSIVERTG